ncbi:hypothetical protein L7F22_061776 [Adiantum nelumboides]|nr:hypothetical protein [Adiantum nelumboides]
MVELFMHNIFKYHGRPQSIVNDRDQRMTSLFWKALFENMDTTLKFSSSFHPQTDRQSEEANSIVLDLLKCYVSEHKETWEHYLPLVEYAYNNTVHTSAGKAPFEIVEGGKKVPPILQTKDKIFEADKYVQNTDEAYTKIKLALEKTQSKQKKAADRHRRELIFSLGDWVLLRFEKARLRKMKGKKRLFPKLGLRANPDSTTLLPVDERATLGASDGAREDASFITEIQVGESTSAAVLSPSSSGSADEGGEPETRAASASASGTSSDADAEDANTEESDQ